MNTAPVLTRMPAGLKGRLRPLLPKATGDRRILRGPLRNARIVTSWHDYPAALLGYAELPLLRWFRANVRRGETWLDIGAHYGYTAIALSRLVGPDGRVFAFEPVTATAGHLSRTRALNGFAQLSVLPLALGDPESLALHSLPTERGMADSTIAAGDWLEPLLVARFDWLWPRIAASQPRVNGLKIDVQGMEIPVLRGMAGLLATHRPKLALEIHQGVPRAELLGLLESAGYQLPGSPLEPVPGERVARYLDNRSYTFAPA